jgi:hypothetical protein
LQKNIGKKWNRLDCEVITYGDQGQAFFNIYNNEELHFKTVKDTALFQVSLVYLQDNPTANKFKKNLNNE